MNQFAGVYVVSANFSVSAAKTLWSLAAPSDRSCTILRVWVDAELDATEDLQLQMGVATSAGTGTAATEQSLHPNYATAGGAVVTDLTAEPSSQTVYFEWVFNVLGGFLYLPVPEERFTIAGGDFCYLELVTAPAAASNIGVGVVWGEI